MPKHARQTEEKIEAGRRITNLLFTFSAGDGIELVVKGERLLHELGSFNGEFVGLDHLVSGLDLARFPLSFTFG